MKKSPRSWKESWDRFFKPAVACKKLTFFLALYWVLTAIFKVAHVEFFRYATSYLEQDMLSMFLLFIWCLFLLKIWDILSQRCIKYYDYYIFNGYRKYIYEFAFSRFLLLDNNFSEKLWTWRLQSIITTWVFKWTEFLFESVLYWSRDLIQILFWLVIIFRTDYRIWYISIIALLIVYIVFLWRNSNDRELRKVEKELYISIDRISVMQMMSKFDILQSDRLSREVSRVNERIDSLSKQQTKRWFYNFLAYRWIFFVFDLLNILVIGIVWRYVFNSWMALSDFFVVTLAFWLFSGMLENQKELMRTYSRHFVNVEKLRDILDNWPKIQWVLQGSNFVPGVWSIYIQDMSFGYEWSSPIFQDFSLNFSWWWVTALVWLSWAGKTTLVKLIAWYLRPTAWSIWVDGQDLTEVSLKSYYRHIWYLTQEPSVFDGTVLENLTYALDETYDTEQLKKIITLAKCEFIYDFPEGIYTEIGERWVRLSGGQRQRLAIAKVFLKDPEILILDEPTAALDSFSEEAITEAMHNLFADRTVIIIAHRLQTVKQADDIIVLDQWMIQERGTHDELVTQGWHYAKMLELQSGF